RHPDSHGTVAAGTNPDRGPSPGPRAEVRHAPKENAPLRGRSGAATAGPAAASAHLAVAVLVLLAAAAGAGVVAADLGLLAHDGGPGGARGRGLAAGKVGHLVLGAVATGVGVLELGLAQLGLGLGAL